MNTAADVLTGIPLGLWLSLHSLWPCSLLAPLWDNQHFIGAPAFHVKCISRYCITCCSSCWSCDNGIFASFLFSNWISQDSENNTDFSYLFLCPSSFPGTLWLLLVGLQLILSGFSGGMIMSSQIFIFLSFSFPVFIFFILLFCLTALNSTSRAGSW